MNRKDFEIMAPVGSYESLHAAINAGADAVYFGVEGLNMRARSSANFTLDDLRNIASLCAEHGVRTYLTVNTVIYDNETAKCHAIIDAAHDAGITAIIASDISAILYARSRGVNVHISTQVNITNVEALRFYSQWADVVVLARELNLDQVKAIHDAIVRGNIRGPKGDLVRIEMFCHGALCMAVSGKCYLSLHQMNSSANRGSCTQICRRSYTVTDKETGDTLDIDNQYIMSPKDLKTIHFLDRLIDAGVSVFKIEGRARGPEYVDKTVRAYDEALTLYCHDKKLTPNDIQRWDTELAKVFNRGFWDGYYLGQRLGEWSAKYGSSATRVKHYAAKCLRYFPKLKVGEFLLEAGTLSLGDEVVITGPNTGILTLNVESIHTEGPVSQALKGEAFAIPVPEKVRPGDRLYIWEKTNIESTD